MFISSYRIEEEREAGMQQDVQDPRDDYYRTLKHRRPRGPRFALLMLIIFAIMSVLLAILVAYVII